MRRSVLAVALALPLLTGCGMTTVKPGFVGIKVNNVGSRRGVQDTPIVVGRVFYNPFTEDVYTYPTFAQNYVWTASLAEGKNADESITFNAAGGVSFNADVGVVIAVRQDSVPALFQQYRRPVDDLIDTVIRNEVRDAFNRAAGGMQPLDIMAARKSALLDSVQSDLNRGPLASYMRFETVSFVSAPRPPKQIAEAINAVFSANQAAAQANQKIAQSRAEAEQMIAVARGDSARAVIAATGEAEANRRLAASLSPVVVQYKSIAKWNGVLPTVTSGAVPLISFPLGNR